MKTVRFYYFLIPLLFLPSFVWAQSDFKLSTESMPALEDALIALPPPMSDSVVREALESKDIVRPKGEEILKQVVNALKTRQFSQALPKLEYLQGLRTQEPDLLILRGCIYAESGRADVAEGLFRKTISIAPSHPWARLNLAEALLTQKKYPEAEANLTILSSIRPESEVVRFKLILALVLQKKIKLAEQELQQLQDRATTPAYYFSKAAISFASGDTQQGKDAVEQARKIYGEQQISYFYGSLANQGWLPR
jgi:predicted Zn-dependent protease